MLRTKQGDKIVLRYHVGDRVVVCIDEEHFRGKIVRLGDLSGSEWEYMVRLDGERQLRGIMQVGIVKQADTGGMGPVKHLKEI